MGTNRERNIVTKSASGRKVDILIVEAIAEATGQRPTDVPPLYDSIDLEALSAVVIGRDGEVEVAFEHQGCAVTVAGDVVTVEPK